MNPATPRRALLIGALLIILTTGTAAAAGNESDSGSGLDIDIDLGGVIDALDDLIDELSDFTGSWDDTLKEILTAVLFAPFRTLAQQLLKAVALVLTNTPTVYPNPAVEEVHRETLLVSYVLATLGFVWAGILYMVGPILGVSYAEVRRILPRLVFAMVLASVSLPIMQLAVDLSDALVLAFAPGDLFMSVQELVGLSVGLVLAWVIDASLLLAVVVMFIIRDVYILFVAAISPLLLLAWVFPRSKRYADTFLATWVAALAMGPMDMLVLKFVLALMSGAGGSALQSISNWVLGVAGMVLLLIVPYQLYGMSQVAVGWGYSLAGKATSNVPKRLERFRKSPDRLKDDEREVVQRYRRQRRRRGRRDL